MKLIKIVMLCLLLNACFGTSKQAKFYTQFAVINRSRDFGNKVFKRISLCISVEYVFFEKKSRRVLYESKKTYFCNLKSEGRYLTSRNAKYIDSPP